MSKKTIKMVCYGPIAFNSKYNSPWEDVWINYKIKRKVIQEGPCFICGVDSEIEREEWMIEKYPEHAEYRGSRLKELYKIKERFLAGEEFVILEPVRKGMPNIYINRDKMFRKDVEDATEWHLKRTGALKSKPRFKWFKPDFLLIPT